MEAEATERCLPFARLGNKWHALRRRLRFLTGSVSRLGLARSSAYLASSGMQSELTRRIANRGTRPGSSGCEATARWFVLWPLQLKLLLLEALLPHLQELLERL